MYGIHYASALCLIVKLQVIFLNSALTSPDGVMIQITAENMDSLRQALREMKDFTIACGKMDVEEPQEHVHIQWVEDDKNVNKG